MNLFWFLAGICTAVLALIAVLRWLRRAPRWQALPAPSWPVTMAAIALMALVLGLARWVGLAQSSMRAAAPRMQLTLPPVMSAGAPAASAANGARANAGSMESAIASLESKLAKGGGSAEDWELLAKSFEFLGRPEDAAKARAHQLPAAGSAAMDGSSTPAGARPNASGLTLSGEIALAAALRAKAVPGETLFIVAKSVDSPGAPVAVYRTSVDSWPLKFTLDDSLSMIPGRNLSSAGRVTVEARISRSGQALPAAGDLRGSSAAVNPADRQPLAILIDQVVP